MAKALKALVLTLALMTGLSYAGDYKVAALNESLVYPGKTLITDISQWSRQAIVEVDMQGRVLWRHEPFIPMRGLLLDATYLDNGHIMYTVKGHGIVEIDRTGKTVWEHRDDEASHDADRLPNGNTLYNRAWVSKGVDAVREITPAGEVVWSWNGLADFDKLPFDKVYFEGWMHVNSVSRLASGNTMISIRNFNTIVEVNQSGRVVRRWTFNCDDSRTIPTSGPIKGELNHEPEMLASGNILVALRSPLRYVEFNPETQEIVWQWQPPAETFTLSHNRDANRLPNGNTLVTTANQLVEVTADGTVAWVLNGASRSSTGDPRVFHKAIRLGEDGKIYGQ